MNCRKNAGMNCSSSVTAAVALMTVITQLLLSDKLLSLMLMSTMSSLYISISIRKKLMLMLMSRLSSLAHKLLMLMFMLMLASLVRIGL